MNIAKVAIGILLAILVIISMAFVYVLLGFHIYLTRRNETTN